jgi:hypothetical protein
MWRVEGVEEGVRAMYVDILSFSASDSAEGWRCELVVGCFYIYF